MDKCPDHSSCTNTNNIKDLLKVALKQLRDLWNARFGLWPHTNSHPLCWVGFPQNGSFPPLGRARHTGVGRGQALLPEPPGDAVRCHWCHLCHPRGDCSTAGQALLTPALLLTWAALGAPPSHWTQHQLSLLRTSPKYWGSSSTTWWFIFPSVCDVSVFAHPFMHMLTIHESLKIQVQYMLNKPTI